jgi:DMSO reductase iron-sulfur subunit
LSVARARKGFRLDTDLCTGCGACAVACAVENELPWGTSWRWIETFNPRHLSGVPSYHLSLACNHCADAPCMEHCPALAYERDHVAGAVLLDPDKCIGCRYCTWACPYDAPRFDPEAGVVSKCTFCHHRQLEGLAPACVQQCPTGALTWGNLDGLDGSAEIAGFPATDARPSVRFAGGRGGVTGTGVSAAVGGREDEDVSGTERATPATVGSAAAVTPPPPGPSLGAAPVPPKTSLATEGPLVLFTLLAATLAGTMATASGRALLGLPAFLILAAVAAGASTLHLGQKGRAWRAVLNVRRSWLSREIALFTLFVAASAAVLSPLPTPRWAGWAVAVLGFALLFAVDRVYAVTRTPGLVVHSAGVLSTGVMAAGVAAGSAVVWGALLCAKIISYVLRKARLREEGRPVRGVWTGVRLAAGAAASGLLITAGPQGTLTWGATAWVAVGVLAVGEIVDRCEFYLELEVSTPREEMGKALAAWVEGVP